MPFSPQCELFWPYAKGQLRASFIRKRQTDQDPLRALVKKSEKHSRQRFIGRQKIKKQASLFHEEIKSHP